MTEFLADILDAIREVVIALDHEWRFTYFNQFAREHFIVNANEVLGRSIWDTLPQLRDTPFEQHCRRASATRQSVSFEMLCPLCSRWMAVHIRPTAHGWVIHQRDIHERKLTEEKLREGEMCHRLISDLTSDYNFICRVEPDGALTLESVTAGFTTVTGYTVEEVNAIGGWGVIIHADDQRQLAERDRGWIDSGERLVDEVRLQTKTGQTRWLRYNVQAVRDRDGRLRILGAAQDITSYRYTEKELRQTQEFLAALLEHAPTPIFVISADGHQKLVNRAWEDCTGLHREQVIGRRPEELFPGPIGELFTRMNRRILDTKAPIVQDEWLDFPGGRSYYHSVRFPLFNAAGDVEAIGGIGVDITHRREAEQQAQDYARQLLEVQERERRHLARELHDQIGQELTALHFLLQASRRSANGALRERLEETETLAQALMGRVRQMSLDLRPSMLDDLGLIPALQWLCDRVGAQTPVRVQLQHQGEGRLPPQVETATYRIVQEALTNVVRHAGPCTATVRLRMEPEVISVSVEDAGIGFDSVDVRRRAPSSGLSSMHERATLLGGQVQVDSRPGAGTRILAKLPMRNGEH